MDTVRFDAVALVVGIIVAIAIGIFTLTAPKPELSSIAQETLKSEYDGPYMSVEKLENGQHRITHHRPSGDRVETWDGARLME